MISLEELKIHHEAMCNKARELVAERGQEYADDDDTLETFRKAALMYGCEPKDVARMMICIKVARLNKKYKIDTVLDLINYSVYYDLLNE